MEIAIRLQLILECNAYIPTRPITHIPRPSIPHLNDNGPFSFSSRLD